VGFLDTCQEQGKDGVCPICSSGPIKEGDLLEVVVKKGSDAGEEESIPKVTIRKNDFVSSTKIEALLRNLRKPSDHYPTPHSDTSMECRTDPRAGPPLPGSGILPIHDFYGYNPSSPHPRITGICPLRRDDGPEETSGRHQGIQRSKWTGREAETDGVADFVEGGRGRFESDQCKLRVHGEWFSPTCTFRGRIY
jgi:hypothetical protein